MMTFVILMRIQKIEGALDYLEKSKNLIFAAIEKHYSFESQLLNRHNKQKTKKLSKNPNENESLASEKQDGETLADITKHKDEKLAEKRASEIISGSINDQKKLRYSQN